MNGGSVFKNPQVVLVIHDFCPLRCSGPLELFLSGCIQEKFVMHFQLMPGWHRCISVHGDYGENNDAPVGINALYLIL